MCIPARKSKIERPLDVTGSLQMSLSADDIVEMHDVLEDWFSESPDPISPPGVKDMKLVESAVARPYQTVDKKDAYETTFDKGAALFHSLINNHAFHNGNKRVALVSAQVLLAEDGYWLERPSDDEMFEFARAAAAHELTEDRDSEVKHISDWFEKNSRKAIKGEHPLKYGELKENLKRFGFEIDPPDKGNLLNIYKDGIAVERVNKQGMKGFRPYHTDYIAGLRKRLDLTPEHGVDSAKFYGNKGTSNTASQFIELRINVMNKLAKT
jgi:death-on-curing protein